MNGIADQLDGVNLNRVEGFYQADIGGQVKIMGVGIRVDIGDDFYPGAVVKSAGGHDYFSLFLLIAAGLLIAEDFSRSA